MPFTFGIKNSPANAENVTQSTSPIWVRGNGAPQRYVGSVIEILEDSWTHGLNPKRYNIDTIKAQMEAKNPSLESTVTDAILKYAQDITGMRGQIRRSDPVMKYWRTPISKEGLLNALRSSNDPIRIIRGLEPQHSLYKALRKELIRLSGEPNVTSSNIIVPKKGIKVGQTAAQIPQVRERLGLPAPRGIDPLMYDEALAVRIMKIQNDNGMEPSGTINRAVMEVINEGREDKIWQILVNMERLRWISEDKPAKYILVNIPSANLWAVERGDVTLEMPVIVGKTARPTYSFKTDITGVRFNPNWTVPRTIKEEDFLPALRADPLSLSKRGIKLSMDGRSIDPATVDWNTITPQDMKRVHMTQKPGSQNPLGKIRVLMDNPYDIYLHDTNHRELFDAKARNLSSGCIRVSNPEGLAAFIMSGNKDWTRAKMDEILESGRMQDVAVDKSLPVYITYQTVWLNADGGLVYGRDVYGQDKKLAGILKASGAAFAFNPLKKH